MDMLWTSPKIVNQNYNGGYTNETHLYFEFNLVYQILYWKDKKLSAMSLASVNLMFLIHFISRMNFFTLASYLLLFYIIVGVAISKTIQTTYLQT